MPHTPAAKTHDSKNIWTFFILREKEILTSCTRLKKEKGICWPELYRSCSNPISVQNKEVRILSTEISVHMTLQLLFPYFLLQWVLCRNLWSVECKARGSGSDSWAQRCEEQEQARFCLLTLDYFHVLMCTHYASLFSCKTLSNCLVKRSF